MLPYEEIRTKWYLLPCDIPKRPIHNYPRKYWLGENKFISLKLLKPVDIFNISTKVLSTEFYLDTTDLAFCLLPSFQSILNSIPQFVVLFKFIDF